ncbi:hypothetical protein ILYODFUR_034929 [Ilyodon furcidens]|uniref:Uncharacterized protein n=1 Tax=Ilyodon furcidens TaxID=33524 RepID=A0ABV0UXQ2_9TELE
MGLKNEQALCVHYGREKSLQSNTMWAISLHTIFSRVCLSDSSSTLADGLLDKEEVNKSLSTFRSLTNKKIRLATVELCLCPVWFPRTNPLSSYSYLSSNTFIVNHTMHEK